MNWWTRVKCFLIGWNPEILKNCSEASYKALKKYSSSILILLFIWGATGYTFAQRYLSIQSWWGCAITALIFIVIVIQIERQVILTVGKNTGIVVFRIILAVLMAVIGSTILDQIIFKNDVEKVLVDLRTDKVNEIAAKRQKTIQLEIDKLNGIIDSLETINSRLNDEVAKKPTIQVTNVKTEKIPVRNNDGSKSFDTKSTVETQHVANTRIEQIKTNYETISKCRNRLEILYDQKINIEQTVRKELEENSGFLEELKAMIVLIKSESLAGAFYFLLFSFIIALELLVVVSKIGDKKCDYDMIIEYQLNVKSDSLKDMVKNNK
ncbi:MAG: hypothetical protein H6Q20_1305 [Bacteroidetes bacterium]|jgi:hypothetical protein|nr:hypothetical protein [Bacteroidota bacterium]